MVISHGQEPETYVVIGAGIYGLSAAYHLASTSGARVILIDQHPVGHPRGSSHGRVRIARSAYGHPGYVHLMRRAFDEAWPQLAKACGQRLLSPRSACIFGPAHGIIDAYAEAIAKAGARIESLTPQQAEKQFVGMRLAGQRVLQDHTAAIINAEGTRQGLTQLLKAASVDWLDGVRVHHIVTGGDRMTVATTRGEVKCDRIIIAAGAWTERLVPQLKTKLCVNRQNVGFFQASRRTDLRSTQNIWIYLGLNDDDLYYGLPENGNTAKAAAHIRNGPRDDPDDLLAADSSALGTLDGFMAQNFTTPFIRTGSDTCPYTSTINDDFIIDQHPDDERIIVAAGFSGHGFKFGPLIGRVLAELVLTGHTTVDEFVDMQPKFSIGSIDASSSSNAHTLEG